MKRKTASLITQIMLVAIAAFLVGPLPASGALLNSTSSWSRVAKASEPGLFLAQGGPLRERLREREQTRVKEVASDLEKNPKLVDDPNYLEQHPRLAHYLKNHPEAKQKIKNDPKGFFQHLEGRQMGG